MKYLFIIAFVTTIGLSSFAPVTAPLENKTQTTVVDQYAITSEQIVLNGELVIYLMWYDKNTGKYLKRTQINTEKILVRHCNPPTMGDEGVFFRWCSAGGSDGLHNELEVFHLPTLRWYVVWVG